MQIVERGAREAREDKDAIEPWLLNVIACPSCKGTLTPVGPSLHCGRCRLSYRVEDGIPSLLPSELNRALLDKQEPVKGYYLEERYDWTRDPKALELAYHRYRRWETWRQIERTLRPEDTVLDIGCGTGLITAELAKRRQRTVAIDLNRWALSRMDGKPYVNKVQGDAESLPIQGETIDLVIATEMMEHLQAPEKMVLEVLRVCRHGARVIGSVPSTSRIWGLRRQLSLTCPGNEPFHNSYTRSSLAELWRVNGVTMTVTPGCLGLNWIWTVEKR